MSFHKVRLQKAKKNHVCDWCDSMIKKDEKYFYHVGICEGNFSTLKYHEKCQSQVDMTLSGEGMYEYELEELKDIYNDYYKEKFEQRRDNERIQV